MTLIRPQFGAVSPRQQTSANPFVPAGKLPQTQDTVEIKHPIKKPAVKFAGDPDHDRYIDIAVGKVRDDLSKFILPKDVNVGEKDVSVPINEIELPRFMRGTNEQGNGQGQGQEGDQVGEIGEDGEAQPGEGAGEPQPGKGKGEPGEGEEPGEPGEEPGEGEQAGDKNSGDLTEEEWASRITRKEIAEMIGKDLELPNFQPRGGDTIQKFEDRYRTVSRLGPSGMVHLKKTLQEYIKRLAPFLTPEEIRGEVPIDMSKIPLDKQDFRYKAPKPVPIPKERAVVFYVIDTSGSMNEARKTMARNTNFFLSTYIQNKYGEINANLRNEAMDEKDFGNGVTEVFINHDVDAVEVPEKDFYSKSKGSSTNFAPAYELIEKQVNEKYPLDQWNVYIVHYTDGDNYGGGDDNPRAIAALKRMQEKGLNMYAYVETREGRGGSGTFKDVVDKHFKPDDPAVRSLQIPSTDPQDLRRAVHEILGNDEARAKIREEREQAAKR